MIAELVANDVDIYNSENLYEIFQKFVEKKVDIWKNNTEFGRKFIDDSFIKYEDFDMMKLYQLYAIRIESQTFNYELYMLSNLIPLKLKLMRQIVPSVLTNDEISRMGILYINDNKNFKFSHSTFSEFFAAQYLIKHVYYSKDEPAAEEAELRIAFFRYLFKHPGTRKFIDYFLRIKSEENSGPFGTQISKIFKTKHKYLLYYLIDCHSCFKTLFNFLKKDRPVLKHLLQVGENSTFYTSMFNFAFVKEIEIDRFMIKNLTKTILNESEYDEFIRGKNQRAVILYGSYFIGRESLNNDFETSHDYYKLDNYLLSNDNLKYVFESIVNTSSNEEFKALLESGMVFCRQHMGHDSLALFFYNLIIWDHVERVFNISEQKEIITNIFKNLRTFDIQYVHNILENFVHSRPDRLKKVFTNDEIHELFIDNNILYKMLYYGDVFKGAWDFFFNITTRDQQIAALKQTSYCEFELCYPYGLLLGTFIHSSEPDRLLVSILEIYKSYFNEADIQEIVLSHSSDFLPYSTIKITTNNIKYLVAFLKQTFAGNEKALSELLLREIKSTNQNIFESSNYNYVDENKLELFIGLIDNSKSIT